MLHLPHMTRTKNSSRAGFTLIEILIVIGIIAILAAVVIIAINPARQFAQARNTQRESNINTILNAVGQRLADNRGIFSGGTPNCPVLSSGTIYTIATNPPHTSGSVINLACLTPTYIPSQLPVDPESGVWTSDTNYDTGYTIKADSLGRYTVCAPESAEAALGTPPQICVTR